MCFSRQQRALRNHEHTRPRQEDGLCIRVHVSLTYCCVYDAVHGVHGA